LALLFALNGSFMAAQDALEGAMTADQVERANRSTAYGVMAAVNGVGDFAASAIVGLLWTLASPMVAFAYAAILMWSGAGLLAAVRRSGPHQEIHE
jgi:predicted MFS family arabinose efflux permease